MTYPRLLAIGLVLSFLGFLAFLVYWIAEWVDAWFKRDVARRCRELRRGPLVGGSRSGWQSHNHGAES